MVLFQTSVPRVAPFKACKAASLVVKSPTPQRHVICAANVPNHVEKGAPFHLDKMCRLAVAGVLASGLLWLSPSPAEADMQMVSPQMVTQMARPLPKQTVDKGKIWTVFIGGAVLLFGVTIVAENNEQFFPAISRANKAFRLASEQIDEMEERQRKEEELLRLRQAQYDEEQRQLALVQQGMKDARTKVLGSGAGAAPAASAVVAAAAPPAPAAPAAEPPAPAAESHSEPAAQASTSAGAASSAPYVVVQDAVPDMGAVAWPAGAAAASAVASTSAHAQEPPAAVAGGNGTPAAGATEASVSAQEDAESVARLARLQGFVSGTMAGGMSPLEAYKAQQRQ